MCKVYPLLCFAFLTFQNKPCVMSPRESLSRTFYQFHQLIGALFISVVSSHTVLTNPNHPYFTASASQLVREMCAFFKGAGVFMILRVAVYARVCVFVAYSEGTQLYGGILSIALFDARTHE